MEGNPKDIILENFRTKFVNNTLSSNNDEEFESFEKKVDEIGKIIQNLTSKNEKEVEAAQRRADVFLSGSSTNDEHAVIDDAKMHVKTNKTFINQDAFDNFYEGDPANMSQAAFMKSVEIDANRRAKERKERQERADDFMHYGNKAFKKGEYEEALLYFDKALEQVKSSLLYTNRALTLLKLGLYERVLEDCDKVFRLNENSLKALLYKAHASYKLGDNDTSEKCIIETKKIHPKHIDFIEQYKQKFVDEV